MTAASVQADVKRLFDTGAHFAQVKSRRHPSMKPFIIGTKGRQEIIDLAKTGSQLESAKKAMELVDCLQFAERPIGSLSAGERQRVAIARALAQDPEIILLDEPTSHLDISFQLEIMELLLKLSEKEGLTVLSVFHDLNLAAVYCKRLLLLKDGKVLSYGNSSDVLKPKTISEKLPCPRDCLSLEIIPQAKVPKHLKETQVTGCFTNNFDICGAGTFLYRAGTRVRRRFIPQHI